MNSSVSPLTPTRFDAVLFDLDGVLTATAAVHAACWKQVFDRFLRQRPQVLEEPFRPFDLNNDYRLYVDGKPRYEGVKSFLASRGIILPYGNPDSPSSEDTICGLGNRKDELFEQVLERTGVEVYDDSVQWVRYLRSLGIKIAVVSSSRQCASVLKAAGISDLFELRVDGVTVDELHLKGKPFPDTFLKAAELLGVNPKRAVVVEDALAGVQAGQSGGFGLVIGVARSNTPELLRSNGASLVVTSLREMLPSPV